jgi:hypothetical protein
MTEQQHEVAPETEQNANPAALSLVGGFVGTVTGLKRNGISGAVVGGLVGGTVGYVGGASLNEDGSATPEPEIDTEPVSVTVSDASDDDDADDEDHSDDESDADDAASEETTDADDEDDEDE